MGIPRLKPHRYCDPSPAAPFFMRQSKIAFNALNIFIFFLWATLDWRLFEVCKKMQGLPLPRTRWVLAPFSPIAAFLLWADLEPITLSKFWRPSHITPAFSIGIQKRPSLNLLTIQSIFNKTPTEANDPAGRRNAFYLMWRNHEN